MKKLRWNELYIIFHDTWIYKFLLLFIIFYGALACMFIFYGRPLRIDKEFMMYYPVIFFVWLIDFILPGLAWYINYKVFHICIHTQSIQIPLLKGYNRKNLFAGKALVSILAFFLVFIMSIIVSYIFALGIYLYDIPISVISGTIGNINSFAFVLISHLLIFLALQPTIFIAMFLSMYIKSTFIHMVAFYFSIISIRFFHLALLDINVPIYKIFFTYYEKAFISFYDTKTINYESNVMSIIVGIIVCILTSVFVWIITEQIFKRKQL